MKTDLQNSLISLENIARIMRDDAAGRDIDSIRANLILGKTADIRAGTAALVAENKRLRDVAQRVAFIFSNEANYPEGTIGHALCTDAKAAISAPKSA